MLYFRNKKTVIIKQVAACFCLIITMSSCGFTPVHHYRADNVIQNQLAYIDVTPIAGRSGLLLHNRLTEKLSPLGVADIPQYTLHIKLATTTESLLIQLDNSSTRKNLRIRAEFILINASTGSTIYKGIANSVASYNVVSSEFATISAEKNSSEKAVREIGEQVFDLLIIYFNKQ
jgi:LPS-assembly lipoprotein